MSERYRITIRNVDPELADLFRDLAVETNLCLGDMFDDAVLALEQQMIDEQADIRGPGSANLER